METIAVTFSISCSMSRPATADSCPIPLPPHPYLCYHFCLCCSFDLTVQCYLITNLVSFGSDSSKQENLPFLSWEKHLHGGIKSLGASWKTGASCEATLIGFLDGGWPPRLEVWKVLLFILLSLGRKGEPEILVYNCLHLQYKPSLKIFRLQDLESFQVRDSVSVLG